MFQNIVMMLKNAGSSEKSIEKYYFAYSGFAKHSILLFLGRSFKDLS